MEEQRKLSFFVKKLTSATIAISLVDATEKIVALTILPIFTYFLSPKDFGIISLVSATTSFLTVLYNPGIISATKRLLYDNESLEHKQILFGSSFIALLSFAFFVLVLSLFLGNWFFGNFFIDFPYWPYGFMGVATALLVQPNRLWYTLMTVQYKIKNIAIWSVISFITGVFISIVFVVILKYGAIGRVLGNFLGQSVLFTIAIITLINYSNFKFSIKTFGKTLKLGYPLTLSVWSYVILNISDRYIINHLLDIDSVGIYDFAYKISTIPIIIGIGFKQVWSPMFYENMVNKRADIISKLSIYYILIFATSCGIFILFSADLVHLFINNKFYRALPIIPWVTGGIFFYGILGTFSAILEYEKRFKLSGTSAAIAAIINIGLNFIFIRYFNIIGAAMATFFAYFIYLFLILILTKKSIPLIFNIKLMLICSIFFFISFLYQIIIIHNNLLIKIGLLICWISYIIISRTFFSNEEKYKIFRLIFYRFNKKAQWK